MSELLEIITQIRDTEAAIAKTEKASWRIRTSPAFG
jgi:hypothetical protein